MNATGTIRRALACSACLLALAGGASSGCQGDACDAGATRCEHGGVYRCERDCGDFGCGSLQWFAASFCSDTQRCIQETAAHAACAESDAPDPQCPAIGGGAYCTGDAIAACADGYRTLTTACGATSTVAGLAPTCVPTASGAACVPREARPDARCAAGDGAVCDGALLVECVAGLAASITACARCDAAAPANCTNCSARQGACTGYLGVGCQVDGDCAAGLACHPLGSWGGACSTPCAIGTDDCLRTFAAGGPPLSTWTPVFRPGATLGCFDGYCSWRD